MHPNLDGTGSGWLIIPLTKLVLVFSVSGLHSFTPTLRGSTGHLWCIYVYIYIGWSQHGFMVLPHTLEPTRRHVLKFLVNLGFKHTRIKESINMWILWHWISNWIICLRPMCSKLKRHEMKTPGAKIKMPVHENTYHIYIANMIQRAGWGFLLVCRLSRSKCPSQGLDWKCFILRIYLK